MPLKLLPDKKKIAVIILSILNAFFLAWLTFVLLSLPYVLPDEYLLVQATSATKNLILNLEQKPDSNRFLFVNVAWDKILVDRMEKIQVEGESEEEALEIPIGNEPITDRGKLALLFDLLLQKPNNHKFLVIDVFFKGATTEDDSVMLARLNQIPNVLVSYHRDEKDKPDYPDLKVKALGLSDIEKIYDQCLKFKIFHNDSIKSTPLLMYEKMHGKKFKKAKWIDFINTNPVLRSFILDYRIRNFDYTNTNRYAKVHLGEWLNTTLDTLGNNTETKEFYELTKNRIVFVGDFEDRDIHETIYGKTPGPLILLDAFLALEAGDNVITIQFIVFLLVFYYLISYITLKSSNIYGKWLQKLNPKANKDAFMASLTIYLLFFAFVSTCSYFLFNIHVGVLILAFYMNIVEKAKRIIQKRIAKRVLKLKALEVKPDLPESLNPL